MAFLQNGQRYYRDQLELDYGSENMNGCTLRVIMIRLSIIIRTERRWEMSKRVLPRERDTSSKMIREGIQWSFNFVIYSNISFANGIKQS